MLKVVMVRNTRLAALLRISEFVRKFEGEPWKFFLPCFVYTWLCCLFAEWDVKLPIAETCPSNAAQRIPPSEKPQPGSNFYTFFQPDIFLGPG